MSDTVALDVKNLNLDLGGKRVCANINLTVRQENFLVLSGLMVEAKPLFLRHLLASLSQQKETYLSTLCPTETTYNWVCSPECIHKSKQPF